MSKERKAKRKTWLYLVGQIILWWYFHLVFRMKVVGAENVPQEGPVLLCSNHLAKRDPVLLGLCQKAAGVLHGQGGAVPQQSFWAGCSACWGPSR